jgi:AraC-like DNA-binding protein
MDPLAGFLDGPRARSAFLLRSIMAPPWSLRIEDHAPLTLVAVVQGDAWVLPDGGAAAALSAGDVAIVRGPTPYAVADDPATAPRILIDADQACTTLAGEPLTDTGDLGVRTWGNCADGPTVLLTGTYQHDGQISRRLVDALPPVIVVRGEEWDSPLIELLATEITKSDPGQRAVLDRLLDLLLVGALRQWFVRPESARPARIEAYRDPVVGEALRVLEADPARPWTVATLASTVGVSRAAMARRFHERVGTPPMAFLADLRLATASDLLLESGATVSGVAARVGYASPFTFSTAFKRAYGVSPRDHRARAAIAG